MATEMMRDFKNILLDDIDISATYEGKGYGLGRYKDLTLFADVTVTQEDEAVIIEEVQAGSDGVQATFDLVVGSADGGTFDIGIEDDMQTVAYNANAGAIQTEIRKIVGTGWDAVTVSGSAGTFVITLPLALEQAELVVDGSGLTETDEDSPVTPISLDADAAYEPTEDSIFTVEVKYSSGGTFDLDFDGDTASTLAYNITAANLKTAIVALDVAYTTENIAVVLADKVYTITFADMAVEEPTADETSLTQTPVSLQIEPQIQDPNKQTWFTLKNTDDSHFFAAITEEATAYATIKNYGDLFRVKYTVTGCGAGIKITMSATAK